VVPKNGLQRYRQDILQSALQLVQSKHSKKHDYTAVFTSMQLLVTSEKLRSCIQE